MLQVGERGIERAFVGEGADVQLIDHRPLERLTGPVVVGPGERAGVDHRTGGVDAVRLPHAARVRQGRATVQGEGVAPVALLGIQGPPAVADVAHRLDPVAVGAQHQVDALGRRGPHRVLVQHHGSRTSKATGRVASRSTAGTEVS